LRIVFPAAPEIMVGIRTGPVLALITMVTSEMIAQAGRAAISVQRARDGPVRDGLRRSSSACSASSSTPRSRNCGLSVVAWAELTHDIAVGPHDGGCRTEIDRQPADRTACARCAAVWARHRLRSRRRRPPGSRLLQQFGNAQYWDNVAITLFRLFSGFSIAAWIGVRLLAATTAAD
jgi:hypothetical protein